MTSAPVRGAFAGCCALTNATTANQTSASERANNLMDLVIYFSPLIPVFKWMKIVCHRGRRRTQRNDYVLRRPAAPPVAIHPYENRYIAVKKMIRTKFGIQSALRVRATPAKPCRKAESG